MASPLGPSSIPTTRRDWIAGAAAAGLKVHRRPNVILILSDDQGYGDLAIHGAPHLRTPTLDRLATQGVEFTRFCVSASCAPTRASLLTGRYHLRCGVYGVANGTETMRPEEVTLADAFHRAGYRTAMFGKWNLGEHYPYVPHARGFDEFIGWNTGHLANYYDTPMKQNGRPYQARGYVTDVVTGLALDFLDRGRQTPFFLYLAYNVPHWPLQVPDRYLRLYDGSGLDRQTLAAYAMLTCLDENIGRLLTRLDRLRIAQDTIVIFLSDNGPNTVRHNCGLRGIKASVYEGGVRVPFLMRWPGRLPAGRSIPALAAHIDVFPTLLDLCGIEQPPGPPLDGVSLKPLLAGAERSWPDRMFFTHHERRNAPPNLHPGAVRTARFNLINSTELYDFPSDPGERHDVAARYPEDARRLRAAYEAWFRQVSAECTFRRRPIPVGYPEENPVSLPAVQANFHGGIRFKQEGWAYDWLTNWTSLEAGVDWDIDVVRAGRYEATLSYLCAPENLGARLHVSATGQSLETVIDRPTSMEPKPNRDVVPRTEMFEMNWGLQRLGVLALEKGRASLAVRVLNIPGRTALELYEVSLRRLDGHDAPGVR